MTGRARGKLMVGAIALLLLVGTGLFEIARARCFQLVGEVLCRVQTNEKIVALTFDDGPTPQGVDAVLPTLQRYRVRATFFVVGQEIERHPDQARRLVLAGEELGNHTYSHQRMVLRWPGTYSEEIARTDALLRAAGQLHPNLLRPPYAKRLIGFPLAVRHAGYRMVTWDIEEDAGKTDPRAYADSILRRVHPGSIVLMHPMYGNHALVGAAVPLIIEGLKVRRYKLVTVSELLKAGGG